MDVTDSNTRAHLMAYAAHETFQLPWADRDEYVRRMEEIGLSHGLQAEAEAIAADCTRHGLQMSAKRVLKALSEFQERQRHRFTPSASGGVTVAAYSRAADPRERVRQLLDPTPDPAVELANVNGLLVGFYGMFVAAGVSRWVFEFSWLGAIAVAVLTLGAGIAGGAIVGGRRSRTR